jgi:hypothetical protein
MIMKKFEMLERIQKETVPAKPAEEVRTQKLQHHATSMSV